MANKQVGEVSFQAGDETYTLRLGSWAIAELESETGRPILDIATEMEDPAKRRMHTMIAVFCAALRQHHPDVDRRQAADIMDRAGLPFTMGKLEEALNLAFPEEGEAKSTNPPAGNRRQRRKAAAGKG